jgi:hypothetical protein
VWPGEAGRGAVPSTRATVDALRTGRARDLVERARRDAHLMVGAVERQAGDIDRGEASAEAGVAADRGAADLSGAGLGRAGPIGAQVHDSNPLEEQSYMRQLQLSAPWQQTRPGAMVASLHSETSSDAGPPGQLHEKSSMLPQGEPHER